MFDQTARRLSKEYLGSVMHVANGQNFSDGKRTPCFGFTWNVKINFNNFEKLSTIFLDKKGENTIDNNNYFGF